MTYQEANHISIKDYLKSLGILPAVDKYYYGMYHSPFRQDGTPSFKVDYGVNLWCDFGTGEGGSLIDLVMKQHGCNAYGAICRLEQYSSGNSFSFQGKEVSERIQHERKQPTSPIDIRKIQPLQNPALMDYLRSRNIPPEMAAHHVQEMYYRIGDKPYFALAFKNDAGGYELRNPRFKGSTSPKDITHIRQSGKKNDSCFVFEGVMDYLSFIAIRQKTNPTYPCLDWQDYIILNSTTNVDKALYPLADYEHIHCFLDNDEAGRKATQAIQKEFCWHVRDSSHLYSEYNREHPHVHIVFNRIDNSGKTISDSNDMYRNEQVCKKLKEKHGLYFAKGKEQVKQHRLKEPDKTKYEIYTAVKNEIRKSRNWQQLQEQLTEKCISIQFKHKGQTNEIQGISFSKGEYTFKGSEIDRSFSFSKLDKYFRDAKLTTAGSNKQTITPQTQEPAINKSDDSLLVGLGGLFSVSSSPVDETPDNPDLRKKKKKKRQFKL